MGPRVRPVAFYGTQYYMFEETGTVRFFEFVWLPAFEDSAKGRLGEEERRALELELLENPTKGPVVPGPATFVRFASRYRAGAGAAVAG